MSGFQFGHHSKRERQSLHSELKQVMDATIKRTDFTIVQGNRSKEKQEEAFESGHSHVHWPNSKHNQSEGDFDMSDAADIMPYPIEWPDKEHDRPIEYIHKLKRILDLQAIVFEEAAKMGIALRWGGMFQKLFDSPHIERVV